ncbi:MAG: amidase [Dehalococcoidia bacterium]
MNGDLRFGSIADARDALDRREISATELARLHLDAISAEDGRLNAFLTVTEADALAGAAAADAALAVGDRRPLLGIPVSLKDLVDQTGTPTTAGGPPEGRAPATEDAAVTRRLRDAGAVLLGKTTLHEFAFGATSENPHYGASRNPTHPDRIAGGSSGGSAAAVAAGFGFASIGTDSGGSIRIPAALCGVVGHKPTFGLVSRFGIQPLAWSADHAGPIARSVADCATVLEVIAGYDPHDPGSIDTAIPDYSRLLGGGIDGLRVGMVHDASPWVEPDVALRFGEACRVLGTLGASLLDLELGQLADGLRCVAILLRVEAAVVHRDHLALHPERFSRDVLARLRAGQFLPATAYLDALRMRRALVRELDSLLETVDLIVLPTVPIVAPRIGTTFEPVAPGAPNARSLLTSLTSLFNLTGLPAVTVPCGVNRAGLPVGLQIVGRRWTDALVLRVAANYERARAEAVG